MENQETKANEPIHILYNSANVYKEMGLTKREYFAVMAMQCTGILANEPFGPQFIAEYAVNTADALIKELNKTAPKSTEQW